MRSLLALLLAFPATAAPVRLVPRALPYSAPAPLVLPAGLLAALASAPLPSLSAPVPAPRTALAVRADADRLYAALADIHSREKAGEDKAALADLKRAFLGDFDGAVAGLPVAETGAELRERVKELRRERSAAVKAADAAPASGRTAASLRLARVSGELAAAQFKTGRELLSDAAPVTPKALRRNAALWSLVGAHNSAAVAAAEAGYLEAVTRGEEAFGDGRPFVYWGRWRDLGTNLEEAARHARNGRPAQAAQVLRASAAALRATRDAADAASAERLDALAAAPRSAAILEAKAVLPHPALKTREAIAYKDMGAALRSLVHALESGREDYLETAAREAGLRRAEALLGSARPTKAEAAVVLQDAAAWAGRGRVAAKRLVVSNAAPALAALERGDLALAARHAGWAADALAERRDELLRIGLSVKRRLLRALAV